MGPPSDRKQIPYSVLPWAPSNPRVLNRKFSSPVLRLKKKAKTRFLQVFALFSGPLLASVGAVHLLLPRNKAFQGAPLLRSETNSLFRFGMGPPSSDPRIP